MGIDADNNLLQQNDRITLDALRWYGKLLMLLKEIETCIVLLDGPYPIGYMKAGGIVFDNFMGLSVDEFDLDHGWPPFSRYSEMYFDQDGHPLLQEIPPLNPAVKCIVNNYCFIGYPSAFFAQHIPTIVVGRDLADLIHSCPQNSQFMRYSLVADRLDTAIKFALKSAGTGNILAFDGATGGFNMTEALADFLREKSTKIEEKVETGLLPKWCRQRNLRIEGGHLKKNV